MAAVSTPQRFAFCFPCASGHINPSLAVARALVERGHEVHYLCREQMREAIEDTGAAFHSEIERMPELYEGRQPDLFGAFEALKREHGISGGRIEGMWKLKNVQVQMMLPGMLRFLREVRPAAVVYCPSLNREAALAAKALGIPGASLLTTAGPGSVSSSMRETMAVEQVTAEGIHRMLSEYEPNRRAVREMNAEYGLGLEESDWTMPNVLGYVDLFGFSAVNLVTTSEELQDPVDAELAALYEEEKVSFAFVGPLLDRPGAKRAGTHKLSGEAVDAGAQAERDEAALLARVSEARVRGRRVFLLSMGTVVTGDHPQAGWNGRWSGPDGRPAGLTGRELCQAAWAGAFDAFGAGAAEEGPLLVLALGPQPDPLGDMRAPPNAVCLPSVPQVDVLRAGVDVFLTHGGQNSFSEAIAHATPVVVCPGFGDQIVNSRKAVDLGLGQKVDKPRPAEGTEAEAVATFRAEVARALREVAEEPSYAVAAARLREGLRSAGGVPHAVELLLSAAAATVEDPATEEAAALSCALTQPDPSKPKLAVCSRRPLAEPSKLADPEAVSREASAHRAGA